MLCEFHFTYTLSVMSLYLFSFVHSQAFFFFFSSLGCHHKALIILSGLSSLFSPQEADIMQVLLHVLASCHKHTIARDESKLLLQLFQEYCLETDSIIVTILKGL